MATAITPAADRSVFPSVLQAATYAHVSCATLHSWIDTGRLSAETSVSGRNRRQYRIAKADLDALLNRAVTVASPTELAVAIDSYLLSLAAQGKSPRTIPNYRSALGQLERFARGLGCFRPEDLTPDLLRRAMVHTMAEGRRRAAREGEHFNKGGVNQAGMICTAARGLARFLRGEGRQVDDLTQVHCPKRQERIQPRVQQHEYLALSRAVAARPRLRLDSDFMATRDDALIRLLCDTGLRASEVVSLDVGDVDLDRGVVVITRAKNGKSRMLGIWDSESTDGGSTLAALKRYAAERARVQLRRGVRPPAFWIGHAGGRLST